MPGYRPLDARFIAKCFRLGLSLTVGRLSDGWLTVESLQLKVDARRPTENTLQSDSSAAVRGVKGKLLLEAKCD
jgi:hypothetical protein